MVDFVKALKRPFSDTNKFLIGTLLGMIPFVNLTVTGYALESTGFTEEKVKRDKLPEWKNYVELFIRGFKATIIGFLLFLPALIVLIGTFGTIIMSSAMGMLLGGVSTDTWNSLFAGQISEIQVHNWFMQNWTQLIPLMLGALPLFLVGAFLAFLAIYMAPIAILGWLKEKRFGAAFSWKVLKKSFNLDYFVNWLVVIFLTGIVNVFLGWIPFIGMGITMYVIGVFSYTVFAEIYERV
jgi:hypothetical protein